MQPHALAMKRTSILERTPMLKRPVLVILAAASLASASIALAASTGPATGPLAGETLEQKTPAEIAFAGAPDGVDPMVTGPVSKDFRARQKAIGCDKAEWPHIPLSCYPG